MLFRVRSFAPVRLAPVFGLAFVLASCSVFGGSKPEASGPQAAADAGAIDPRKFIGPDYCPEIRIREGTEVARQYERGREDDPTAVVWQASVGKTARECLYDMAGNLTLRVGVSGRVVAGPKGGAGTVTLPLRIAVVKHKEAVLASELYPLNVALGSGASTVFSEVREVTVPSPGTSRDYIVYVGFDEKGENLLDPGAARIAAEKPKRNAPADDDVVRLEEPAEPKPAEAPPQAAPAQPPRQQQPNVLPTPSGGFVLSQ